MSMETREERIAKAKSFFLNEKSSLDTYESRHVQRATFDCVYCDKSYPKSELHYSAESSTKYGTERGIFGSLFITSKSNIHMTKMCSRCYKIHTIAGRIHFAIWLICIGIAVYILWKDRDSLGIENVIFNISIACLAAYILCRIGWYFIWLNTGVKRQP